MRRFNSKSFLTAVLLICSAANLCAQGFTPTPVTVSSQMEVVNGHLYYAHTVLEKQTLYSISKAYNIKVEEIYAANPKLEAEGLKKDSVILIPVISKEKPAEETAEAAAPAATPASVPVQEGTDQTVTHTIHTVKWYEDIESIAKKYGLTTQAIIDANNLQGAKLKNKQKLVIPTKEAATLAAAAGTVAVAATAASAPQTPQATETPAEITILPADTSKLIDKPEETVRSILNIKRKVNLSVLLPLNAVSGSSGNANYMDFYSGVLLAARDKGIDGIEVNLNISDVSAGIPSTLKTDAADADAILGPVSPEDMSKVLALDGLNKPVFSPMNPKCENLIDGHPSFVQVPSASDAQYSDMVNWIREDMGVGDRVIVIYEKGSKDVAESSVINTVLKRSGLNYSTVSYKVIDGSHIMGTIQNQMTPSDRAVNRVIIASEKEAFVNDVCRNLNLLLHNNYNVVLYGTSKFRNYDTIEVENLHALNLHISTSYNVDYDSAKVKDFIMKYRALFRTEPTAFAFQGYDLAYYLIDTFAKHGYNWQEYICGERYRMLQTDFMFTREGETNGFVNKAVKRCVFGPNYSIKAVRN